MNKLLYFAISTPDYLDLFELCLKSGAKEMNDNNISVLCIVDKGTHDGVVDIIKTCGIKSSSVLLCKEYTHVHSHWRYNLKLEIVYFDDLPKYDKIVYCDIDILFTKNSIVPLFDIINNDNLYVYKENFNSYKQPYFFNTFLYTDDDIKTIDNYPKKSPINTGVFGWKRNDTIIEQFKSIITAIDNYYDTVEEKNHTYDQVFINHRFLLDQNIEYMYQHLVTISPEREFKHGRVLHFTYINKFVRMSKIYDYIKKCENE